MSSLTETSLLAIRADRLLSRETTFLTHSLTSVAAKYVKLGQQLAEKNQNEALVEQTVGEVVRAMNAYSVEIAKLSLINSGIDSEVDMYSTMATDFSSESVQVASEIVALRQDLEEVKKVRREKAEYDAVASSICGEGSEGTSEIASQISALNTAVDLIESRRDEIAREVARKERAFQLLLASVYDLKRMLEEEEEAPASMAVDN